MAGCLLICPRPTEVAGSGRQLMSCPRRWSRTPNRSCRLYRHEPSLLLLIGTPTRETSSSTARRFVLTGRENHLRCRSGMATIRRGIQVRGDPVTVTLPIRAGGRSMSGRQNRTDRRPHELIVLNHLVEAVGRGGKDSGRQAFGYAPSRVCAGVASSPGVSTRHIPSPGPRWRVVRQVPVLLAGANNRREVFSLATDQL
jgi:hypothetical protein